jgi:SHS2 domain-containing protein
MENSEFEGKFEFLEHTADVYVAAYGESMVEALGNAGLAMFEVMTDTKRVMASEKMEVEVEAEDEYALLYSWLEALLVKFEVNNMLFSKFEVAKIDESDEGFKLKASVWGEKFDSNKHSQRVAVKAVTYHRMEIIKENDKFTLMFILDI